MAVDEESDVKGCRKANVTVGFSGGGFAMYQLDMTDPTYPIFRVRYLHRCKPSDHNGSEDLTITSMASLGPFLSVMQQHIWTLYNFQQLSGGFERGLEVGNGVEKPVSAVTSTERFRMTSTVVLQAPQILASLRSTSVWPPISLSLRRSVNSTVLAAIVYAYPLYISGWSVGVQELRFAKNESGTTSMVGSRIATAVAAGFTPVGTTASTNAGTWLPGLGPWSRSQLNDPPLSRPTSLSYSHP